MREIFLNNPFIRLCIPFILGIIAGSNAPSSVNPAILYTLWGAIFLYVLLFFIPKNYRYRKTHNNLLIIILFCTGVFQSIQNSPSIQTYTVPQAFAATVIDFPDSTEKSIKLMLDIKQRKANDSIFPVSGKAIVYAQKDNNAKELKPGDNIIFYAQPKRITNRGNPGEFDYVRFAASKGIFYQFYLDSTAWFKSSIAPMQTIRFKLLKIRRKIIEKYKCAGLSDNRLAVFSALTVGDKSMLEKELRQGFADAGLMHILAVSGLHVGILYLAISLMMRPLRKYKVGKWLQFALSIIFLWGYAALTGLSPSVSRAATMFSVFVVGDLLNRRYAVYNSMALAAFILLFNNPLLISNVGFQLSFLAVFGIVYFYPKVYQWIYIPNKWVDKIWQIMAVSIAAQIATTPISLFYFHQFPILFLLTNVLMIPLATVLMYLLLVFLLTMPFPFLMSKAGWVINEITGLMNDFTKWVSGLTWSTMHNIQINSIQLVLMYTILILIVWFSRKTTFKTFALMVIGTILFMGTNIFQDYDNKQRNQFIVFNTFKEPLMMKVSGKSFSVLHPDSAMNYDYFTRSVLQKYQLNIEIDSRAHTHVDGILSFGSDSLNGLFYNNSAPIQTIKPNTYRWLILSKHSPYNLAPVLDKIDARFIIADASVPEYKIENWRQTIQQMNLNIHLVKENGAFVDSW